MSNKSCAIAASSLFGSWTLQCFDIQENDEPTHPWGFNTHGLLIYTATGHMSVSINRTAPWTESGAPSSSITAEEQTLFYAGTYFIEGNIVKHTVTNASDPNRIGTTLIRTASLDSSLLTLLSKGDGFLATLVWKKVE